MVGLNGSLSGTVAPQPEAFKALLLFHSAQVLQLCYTYVKQSDSTTLTLRQHLALNQSPVCKRDYDVTLCGQIVNTAAVCSVRSPASAAVFVSMTT